MTENEIGDMLVEAAIGIHRAVGPGLLESVYEILLVHELRKRDLRADRQVSIPIEYGGHKFDEGFRADILIEEQVIVELKCVERLSKAHWKQLLTYLRLTKLRVGYLLNFSEALMTKGIIRIANQLPEELANNHPAVQRSDR